MSYWWVLKLWREKVRHSTRSKRWPKFWHPSHKEIEYYLGLAICTDSYVDGFVFAPPFDLILKLYFANYLAWVVIPVLLFFLGDIWWQYLVDISVCCPNIDQISPYQQEGKYRLIVLTGTLPRYDGTMRTPCQRWRPNQVHRRHPHTMGDDDCTWFGLIPSTGTRSWLHFGGEGGRISWEWRRQSWRTLR